MEVLTQDLVIEIGKKIRELRPDIPISCHPHEQSGYKLHATVGQTRLYAWALRHGCGPKQNATALSAHVYEAAVG